MPSNTPKQARAMAAAAHDPRFAKKVGIPQPVAQEFNQADSGEGMLHQAMTDRARVHLRNRTPPQPVRK